METASRRPARNWSMVAWSIAGAAAVVFSYAFAIVLSLAFLGLGALCYGIIWKSGPNFVPIILGSFGIVVGLTILSSLIPRRDKIVLPGVPIDLTSERRLVAEIQSVASCLNEALPAEVYLIPEANAFVAQHGRRRILGIGLPLLPALTVPEFRALLAHEFAHFYSGDTRLGPWVYKSRSAMARVYTNLGTESPLMAILTRWVIVALPYMLLMGSLRLFWTLFLRLTQLISRRQEFRSDEIACHVAGSAAFARALRKLTTIEVPLGSYWQQVVFPVAARGYQPEIADGFGRFLTFPQVAKAGADHLAIELQNSSTKPYDTHPPLGARLARVEAVSDSPSEEDSRTAISLFNRLGDWEANLLRKLIPALETTELKPFAWDTVGHDVYVPMWRKEILPFIPLLSQWTLNSLPDLVGQLKSISDDIPNPPGILLNRDQRDECATGILSMALSLALIDNGWTLHAQPGSHFLQRGDFKLIASLILARLKSGELPSKQWQTYCADAEIDKWRLATESTP